MARLSELVVLETAILEPEIKMIDMVIYSGFDIKTCALAVQRLRTWGHISRRHGEYCPTESGRIVWAIWKGKQKRKHA